MQTSFFTHGYNICIAKSTHKGDDEAENEIRYRKNVVPYIIFTFPEGQR
jgi:hypothetical protein